MIYRKGGIGESTTVSSVSAAIVAMGLTAMQIGCGPKADSICNLTGGRNIPTVLNTLRGKDDAVPEDVMVKSPSGVFYVESGGPVPGVGCVGWGIITALEKLGGLDAYEIYRPDVVLYDVLGDIVCGKFAMPIRGDYAGKVYIMTSGGMMSFYAASNIAHTVKSFGEYEYATLRGLILNVKNVEGGNELVDKTAEEIEAPALCRLPRHPLIQQAKAQRKTVIEAFPDSDMATHYHELAQLLIQETAGGGCLCPM